MVIQRFFSRFKIESFRFRRNVFVFVLIFFLIQFINSYKWGYSMFGAHGRLHTNENVWLKTKHGDLAAYSVFLKEHLFIKADPGQILVVPDKHKTKVPFARKFWLGVTPHYIFPAKIKVSGSYEFEITTKAMNQLKSLDTITSVYGNRRYHLVTGLNTQNFSKWAIYINTKGTDVDIFTLPFEYFKKTEKR